MRGFKLRRRTPRRPELLTFDEYYLCLQKGFKQDRYQVINIAKVSEIILVSSSVTYFGNLNLTTLTERAREH